MLQLFINNVYEFAFYMTAATALLFIMAYAMRKLGEVPPGQELRKMKRDDCRCKQVMSCACHKHCECISVYKDGHAPSEREVKKPLPDELKKISSLSSDKGNRYEATQNIPSYIKGSDKCAFCDNLTRCNYYETCEKNM